MAAIFSGLLVSKVQKYTKGVALARYKPSLRHCSINSLTPVQTRFAPLAAAYDFLSIGLSTYYPRLRQPVRFSCTARFALNRKTSLTFKG